MITVKDILMQTNFYSIAEEIKIHYGDEHIEKLKQVYSKFKNTHAKLI